MTAVEVCALKCFSTRLRTSRILSFSNHSSFVEGVNGLFCDTGLSAFNFRERRKYEIKIREL